MANDCTPFSPPTSDWTPPSQKLRQQQGVWISTSEEVISYPHEGNEGCFQVEDHSFWFAHRMNCIRAALQLFPPDGVFYDIGGGNGFVARDLQNAGIKTVLLEPGPGAYNAARRGVRQIIKATLDEAGLNAHSIPAAGAFDVLEHIADDIAFLRSLHKQLAPSGRFYCTVPANQCLWSDDDVHAGHYRRYNVQTLTCTLQAAGFSIEFISPFFLWLTLPVAFFRTLPSRLHIKRSVETPGAIQSDHQLPKSLNGLADKFHAWELSRLKDCRPLAFGTSLLCVARATQI